MRKFWKKTDFDRFCDAYMKRYKHELKEKPSEQELLELYVMKFKGSGKTPKEWFEEQESEPLEKGSRQRSF